MVSALKGMGLIDIAAVSNTGKGAVHFAEFVERLSTINQVLLVCCTPLKLAFNEKIIPGNPVAGLTKFSISNKERGVLTEAEAARQSA